MSAGEVRRLAVTVGTEEGEVFETIVVLVAVDVVQRDAQRASAPFDEAAFLAAFLFETFPEDPRLEVAAAARATVFEQLLYRDEMTARLELLGL